LEDDAELEAKPPQAKAGEESKQPQAKAGEASKKETEQAQTAGEDSEIESLEDDFPTETVAPLMDSSVIPKYPKTLTPREFWQGHPEELRGNNGFTEKQIKAFLHAVTGIFELEQPDNMWFVTEYKEEDGETRRVWICAHLFPRLYPVCPGELESGCHFARGHGPTYHLLAGRRVTRTIPTEEDLGATFQVTDTWYLDPVWTPKTVPLIDRTRLERARPDGAEWRGVTVFAEKTGRERHRAKGFIRNYTRNRRSASPETRTRLPMDASLSPDREGDNVSVISSAGGSIFGRRSSKKDEDP
jgi:hypothetical protein